MSETTAREAWIDVLKGWGMILIVTGHVWSLQDVSVPYMWMFSFHVPLFFFAAGLTLRPRANTTRDFLRRRVRTVLVPYVFHALVGYLFYLSGYAVAAYAGLNIAQFSYGLWTPLFGVFYGSVGDGLLVNSPLWFLPALFVSQGVVHLIARLAIPRWLTYAIMLSCFAMAALVEERIKLPMSVIPALGAAVFVQLGLDCQRHRPWMRWSGTSQWAVLLLAFGVSLTAPVNGAVGLAGPTINHPVLFLLFAVCGLAFSVLLAYRCAPRAGWVALLGRHSMGILVTHMLAIKSVKVLLSLFLGVSMSEMEHSLGWGLLVMVISAVVMWPAIAFIERWLPWTVGKVQTGQRPIAATS